MKDSILTLYRLFRKEQDADFLFLKEFEERLGAPLSPLQRKVGIALSEQILKDFDLEAKINDSNKDSSSEALARRASFRLITGGKE